ncbi:MAG TPA: sigma-70 family RNA polymerase sigma factor [Mycobacteriales bacterium]|nr:sigma-70 family RNA polymerase sigma factor [Mycobacteriales bacterium]
MELPGDAELVARLRARDEAAFALVLDAWSPGMLRLARSFVSTPDSAAECVQDTWLAVIEGLDRFEGRSALRTWVYRILVNTAKRRGVREGRSVPWSSVADESGPTVDPARFRPPGEPYAGHWWEFPAPWPEDAVLATEMQRLVAAAVAELPERQRVVVVLRDIQGYDPDEVSSILVITPGYQRVLLHRGRAHVRARIEAYHARAVTS